MGIARPAAWLLVGVLALVFGLDGRAGAAEEPEIVREPRALIERTAEQVVAILAQRDRPAEERVREIESIAHELFDFTTMSKLVLARHWRKLDTAKKREFVQEFRRHLSRTYGSRLDRYDQNGVDVYGSQLEPRGDVTIRSKVVGGQFDGAELSYRLRRRADEWRIIDVVIEGVSLVSNYRSQFAEVLGNGTIDDLLARMQEKSFDPLSEESGAESTEESAE